MANITPEECAELHRNNMGYIAAIYNRSIELLHNPMLASLIARSVQNQKAIAALPAILTLVEEQQKEIEELEKHHGWMMDRWIPESLQKHINNKREVTCKHLTLNKCHSFTILWREQDD